MAAVRSRQVSRALNTSPMPPNQRAETISYVPSRTPWASAMALLRIETGNRLIIGENGSGARDAAGRRGRRQFSAESMTGAVWLV